MSFRFRAGRVIGTALVLAAVMASPAEAAPAPSNTEPETVVEGLVGPLHISFGSAGRLYIADGFAGQIVKVNLKRDTRETVPFEEGASPSGLDVRGSKVYAVGGIEPETENDMGAAGLFLSRHGEVTEVADTLAYELANNPDGQPQTPGLDSFSNPYDVLVWGGYAYVADAGGNAILKVSFRDGTIKTLTVLPVSKEGDCANVENNGVANGGCDPVPTDLAIGRDGYLYVSGLGAEVAGHIWKIDRRTGEIVDTIEGLPPLTGIEVGPDGSIYASSLFLGQIFRIAPDGTRTVAEVPGPTDVDFYQGSIYAGSVAFDMENEEAPPVGSVVRVPLGAFK